MISLLPTNGLPAYSPTPNETPGSFEKTIFLYFYYRFKDMMIAVNPENFEEFSKCLFQGSLVPDLMDSSLVASMISGDFKSPSIFSTKFFFLDENFYNHFRIRSSDDIRVNNCSASLTQIAHFKSTNIESRPFYQNKCMPPLCHFSYVLQDEPPCCKNCKPIVLYDFVRKIKNQDVSDVRWNVKDLAVIDHCLMPQIDKLTTFIYHYIRNNSFVRGCDDVVALQMSGKTVLEIYNKFSCPSSLS